MFAMAWTLARKDLALFFRDRTALLLALALPILLITVFGAAMKGMMGGTGGRDGGPRVDLFVVDEDGSAKSAELVAALEEARTLDVTAGGEDVRRKVASGDAPAALVIPEGWGAASAPGDGPPLRVLRDPAQHLAQQVLFGTLAQVVPKIAMPGMASFLPDDLSEFLGLEVEDVAGTDERGLPRSAGGSHAMASMAVMMLMFSLVAAGGTLLEEHGGGTLQRLLLAPAAGSAILWGKALSCGGVGLLQLAVLYLYGALVFDVPVLAQPVALLATSLGLVFAATGLGMLFAVVCRSQKQLEGLSTLVILVMSAVGGAWFPREITPEWFRTAGLFTVTAWAMDAFHGILWFGKGLLPSAEVDGVWPQVAVLFGLGAAFLALSARIFDRRFRTP